jgi:hypothetical protein
MPPSKNLLTKIKVKTTPKIDPNEEPKLDAPEIEVCVHETEKVFIPPVTSQERRVWAKARSLQFSNEIGEPLEGWTCRLQTMESDGRLFRIGNVLYRRGD